MIPNLPKPTCAECKPRIALMTIEPDALDLFNDSPLAQHFDIQPLPPPPGGLRGHNQKDFNAGSEQDILDDTFTMLRDITVMSLYADAFVVSANSNVGVIALILGGPDAQISSVDFRFKATSRSACFLRIPNSLYSQSSAGPCPSTSPESSCQGQQDTNNRRRKS